MKGPPDREAAFPGIGKALLLVLALWMCELLVFAAIRSAGWIDGGEPLQAWVFSALLGNGMLLATWLTRYGIGYREVIHPGPASARATLGLVSLPLLSILPAVFLAAGVVQTLLTQLVPMSERQLKLFAELLNGGPASLVALVFVAPVLEELFYRGIILRGLLRRYRRTNALLLSSLIFGAAHLNLYQFVGGGLVGLLLGWLYIRFRSTLPGMFFHAIYNAAFLALALSGSEDNAGFFDAVPASLWFAALPLLAAGGYALARLARRAQAPAST
ncbi:CPBP family intramembrane glutamic endopeptidase [Caenimonas terrae]|uniref:CPBP family intramembrane glutamic endopeptidase n=1 Tax=Caenimonas terrae TaxID=696074 RepID=A0ABW0NJ63_9BURK